MTNITDTLSKEVISVSEATTVGVITNAFFSEKLSRLKGWTVVQDETDEEKLLPPARIIGNGDTVTLLNSFMLKPASGIKCPLGMRVHDSAGKYLGVLRDVITEEENGKTLALMVEDVAYAPSLVLSASREGVIFRAPTHEKLHTRRTPYPTRKLRRERPVHTDTLFPSLPSVSMQEDTESPIPNLPLYSEYAFLLGRTVTKDLFFKGELLAAEGSFVDDSVIESARRQGKLVELTVNSKKL